MLTRIVPKRFLFLNKSILLTTLALLIASAVRPLTATADDNVAVFDFTDDTFKANNGLKIGSNLPSTLTVDNITLTFQKVSNMSPGYYDPGMACLYKKNTLTVTSTDKPIKSIEITAWSGDKTTKLPTAANFSTTPGELTYGGTTCTWSGEATTVTFKNLATGSTRIGLLCIKVYTEEQATTKTTPDLKFSSESATTTVNSSLNVKLNNIPDGATVTYTSSATNIATVSTDGTITPVAPGIVTITASTSSTDSYLQGTAAYNLTVTPTTETAAAIENLYTKISGQSDIAEGGIYLIVYDSGDTPYAMGTYGNSETKRDAASITIEDNRITTAVNQSGKPYEITLASTGTTVDNKNTYLLRNANGTYLYNTGSKNNLLEKSESELTKSAEKQKTKWDTKYNESDGTVSISNYASQSYQVTNYIKYNTESNYFSAYYKTTSANKSVTLYRRQGTVSILTAEGYATLYTDCAICLSDGLYASTITGVDDEATLSTPWEYQPGDTIPAYTGVLLKGEYGVTYTYNYVNTTLENSENCLGGTLINDTPTDDGSNFYRLTYSKVNDTKTLGFYLWNSDGKPGENAAGHAYLKLPKSDDTAVKGFALIDPEATAIHSVTAPSDCPQTIYTLSGLRINATSTDALPAGVYIVGGKKVLVR